MKFNNLGLTLGMALKSYISLANGLKLEIKKSWANSYVCRSHREKTGREGDLFAPASLPSILNRVNIQ